MIKEKKNIIVFYLKPSVYCSGWLQTLKATFYNMYARFQRSQNKLLLLHELSDNIFFCI